MYIITQAAIHRYHTTHLTNMILEVTPSSWFRTAWTSMDPIHWRDPTNDACLSPTSTKAWRGKNPFKAAILGISTVLWLFSIIIFTGAPLYLLDLLVSRHRPLYVALLQEPGADGLEGAISTAPAIVIHMVLHVVVVAVYPLNQAHLEKTHTHTQKTNQGTCRVCLRINLQIFKRGNKLWQSIGRTFPWSGEGCVRTRWGLLR